MSGEQTNVYWNEEASSSRNYEDKTKRHSKNTNTKVHVHGEDNRPNMDLRGSEHIEGTNNEKKSSLQEELRLTEKDLENLHDAIENNKIDEVMKFIKKFPSEKLACHNGKSALSTAFCFYENNLYKLLISKKFQIGIDETLNGMKKRVFAVNIDNLHKPGLHYLTKLFLKCGLTQNCQNDKQNEYFSSILQALINLNKISDVKTLLEILSSFSDLQIAFDFGNGHIGNIDPRKNENVLGCFHRSLNCITIGAKNLVDRTAYYEVYGVMAHEFCHCAMNRIFKNDCKPYFEGNADSKVKYETVVDNCKRNKNQEELISNVFDSNSTAWESELIVRVPQILAAYQKKKKHLNKIKKTFNSLFDFYESILFFLNEGAVKLRLNDERNNANKLAGVQLELNNSKLTPNVSALDELKIDINAQNIQIYQSNCIDFTMKIIYEKLKIDGKLDSFIFCKKEDLNNEEFLKACKEAMDINKETKLIIACETFDQKNIQKLSDIFLPKDDFIFVVNKIESQSKVSDMTIWQVRHYISNLSQNSPILNKIVNFQGTELPLKLFLSECKDIINTYPIDKIFKGNQLTIGKKIEFKNNFTIRKYEHDMPQKIDIIHSEPGFGKLMMIKSMKLKIFDHDEKVMCIDLNNFIDHPEISIMHLTETIARKLNRKHSAIILLDIDFRLSPRIKEFMTILIDAVRKKSKSKLKIATRPNIQRGLKETLNIEIDRVSLSEFEQLELLNLLPRDDFVIIKNKTLAQSEESSDLLNDHCIARKENHELLKFNSYMTYEDLMYVGKLGLVVILSAAAGNGKTTEFQFLSLEFKKQFPLRWVLYIDLKKNVKSFNEQNHPEIFASKLQLADYFACILYKLENYEADIFRKFFMRDRVIILLDGFDEVCPTFKQFIIKLVVSIKKKSNNILLIATRPLFESELKKKLNAEVFRLKGFDVADRKLFLLNIFKNEGISDLEFQNTYDNIENFLDRIERRGEYFHDNTISNPLFLTIIAKVFFEQRESNVDHESMYILYQKFVNRMFEEANKKEAQDVVRDISEIGSGEINLKSHHQKVALEMLWIDEDNDVKSSISTICDYPEPIPMEKLNRVGLMYTDGSNYYFIHKTFAEFFVAQVICENLFHRKSLATDKLEASIKLVKFILNKGDSRIIKMFMDMFLRDCKDKHDHFIISKLSQNINLESFEFPIIELNAYSHLFDFICFKILKSSKEISKIWIKPDLDNFFLKNLSIKRIKTYFDVFDDDDVRKILLNADFSTNSLFSVLENKNENVFTFVLDHAFKKLSNGELSAFFKVPTNYFWYTSAKLNLLSKKLTQEQFKKFLKTNLLNEKNFEKLIKNGNLKIVKWLCTKFREIHDDAQVKNMLRRLDLRKHGTEILLVISSCFKDEELKDLLLQRDNDIKNILEEFHSETDVLFDVCDLYVNAFGIDFMKTSVGSILISTKRPNFKINETWSFLITRFKFKDICKILMDYPNDVKKRTFIQFSFPEILKICKSINQSQTLEILRVVINFLTLDMIQKLCSCLDRYQLSIKLSHTSLELTQYLGKLFFKLLNDEEIFLAVIENNDLKEKLFDLLLDLYFNHYETNDSDQFFYYCQISFSNKVRKTFGSKILKLLLLHDFDSKSILMHLIAKKQFKTLKVIVITMGKYLKPNQIHEVMLRSDCEGNFFLMKSDFWWIYEKYVQKVMRKKRMREYLFKPDRNGKSIQWYINENRSSNVTVKIKHDHQNV